MEGRSLIKGKPFRLRFTTSVKQLKVMAMMFIRVLVMMADDADSNVCGSMHREPVGAGLAVWMEFGREGR